MKLSEFKHQLAAAGKLSFLLPDGSPVPSHFHITEAGLTTKQFVDCGRAVRSAKTVTFQVWTSYDYHHRLTPGKLLAIISKYEELFGEEDLEVEIEYQAGTLGKYGLESEAGNFRLTAKQTGCLAKADCGIPPQRQAVSRRRTEEEACCTPGAGCC